MRQWVLSRLTYANVMATLAVFLVLSGGTAVALSGSNTVFSDDIVDNEVRAADVRNDTLIGGGLGAADLQPGSVGTSEAASNSLGGADIDEASLLVSRVVARPTGGALSTNGMTTGNQTSYPLSNATFTQRTNELMEFASQIKATLATPSGSSNTLCQVEVLLTVDGQSFVQRSVGTVSDQSTTRTTAIRQTLVLPTGSVSSQHTVTATAHLADHSGEGFTNACSSSSQIDSFALHVIGTR
jgi:hypothetical protein